MLIEELLFLNLGKYLVRIKCRMGIAHKNPIGLRYWWAEHCHTIMFTLFLTKFRRLSE